MPQQVSKLKQKVTESFKSQSLNIDCLFEDMQIDLFNKPNDFFF